MATSVLIHWAIIAGLALIAVKLIGRVFHSVCRAAIVIVVIGGALAILAPHSLVGRWIRGSIPVAQTAARVSKIPQDARTGLRKMHQAEHLFHQAEHLLDSAAHVRKHG